MEFLENMVNTEIVPKLGQGGTASASSSAAPYVDAEVIEPFGADDLPF
jgi:hypothetical protein